MYSSQDYTEEPTAATYAYAVPADGYTASVTATDGTYNKCSDKENNLWKITKVSGNTTVTVSASASE